MSRYIGLELDHFHLPYFYNYEEYAHEYYSLLFALEILLWIEEYRIKIQDRKVHSNHAYNGFQPAHHVRPGLHLVHLQIQLSGHIHVTKSYRIKLERSRAHYSIRGNDGHRPVFTAVADHKLQY